MKVLIKKNILETIIINTSSYLDKKDLVYDLVKNGKKFKIQDLAEELGVVRQTASTYIKRLKDMNIVAEINTSMGKLYALNPNIYCRGEEVPEMVLKAFDKPIKE